MIPWLYQRNQRSVLHLDHFIIFIKHSIVHLLYNFIVSLKLYFCFSSGLVSTSQDKQNNSIHCKKVIFTKRLVFWQHGFFFRTSPPLITFITFFSVFLNNQYGKNAYWTVGSKQTDIEDEQFISKLSSSLFKNRYWVILNFLLL